MMAQNIFLFWSADDSSWLSYLIIRVTGRQLPDKSDAWGHMGLGFELENGELVYYECLFSDGFQGPKPIKRLLDFRDEPNHRVSIQPLFSISPRSVELIHSACRGWVGRRGYYAWQLVCMWEFERFGRYMRRHVPSSPNRGVCSEDATRLIYPWMDLRDEVRKEFDEVNPCSAWRKLKSFSHGLNTDSTRIIEGKIK